MDGQLHRLDRADWLSMRTDSGIVLDTRPCSSIFRLAAVHAYTCSRRARITIVCQ